MPWYFFHNDGSPVTGTVTGGVPVGNITPYAGFMSGSMGSAAQAATAPDGYLFCNGAAVSRTTYAPLFAKITTTYGAGDGSTTFNLPNFMDYYVSGRPVTAVSGPSVAGATTHTHTSVTSHLHAIPHHNHAFSDSHTHSFSHNHDITSHQHGIGSFHLRAHSGFGALGRTVSGSDNPASTTHGHSMTGQPFAAPMDPSSVSGVNSGYTDPGTTAASYPGGQITNGTTASNSVASTGITQNSGGANTPVYFGAAYMIKAGNL